MQLIIRKFDGNDYKQVARFDLSEVWVSVVSDTFKVVLEPYLDRLVLREINGGTLVIRPRVANSIEVSVDGRI